MKFSSPCMYSVVVSSWLYIENDSTQLITSSISARCIRQKEYPFTKVCICQMRRSAIHLVDGDRNTAPHPKKGITEESAEKQVEQSVEIRPTSVNSEKQQEAVQLSSTPINILPLRNTEENNAIQKFPKLWQDKVDSTVCRDDGTNIECDKQCKRIDPLSWTDLHLVSTRFGNISIAAKKGQDNRYGLSRISGKSYSGLSRTGILNGPISLSLDVYTSDVTEVRICVDSLQKFILQVFLLFYNSATQEKTIAVDNISLLSGDC
uniref:Uncharacterized protein n=1 Tax=Heterorhabditis bacteriophora TaxID=37862 RepID=A0A1I7XJT1_HETBA